MDIVVYLKSGGNYVVHVPPAATLGSFILPNSVYMCSVRHYIFLNIYNRLVCLIEIHCAFCEKETEVLYVIYENVILQAVNIFAFCGPASVKEELDIQYTRTLTAITHLGRKFYVKLCTRLRSNHLNSDGPEVYILL